MPYTLLSDGPEPSSYRPQQVYIRPGQTLDCAVQSASDWDHWSRSLDTPSHMGLTPAPTGQEPLDNGEPWQGWAKDDWSHLRR